MVFVFTSTTGAWTDDGRTAIVSYYTWVAFGGIEEHGRRPLRHREVRPYGGIALADKEYAIIVLVYQDSRVPGEAYY